MFLHIAAGGEHLVTSLSQMSGCLHVHPEVTVLAVAAVYPQGKPFSQRKSDPSCSSAAVYLMPSTNLHGNLVSEPQALDLIKV